MLTSDHREALAISDRLFLLKGGKLIEYQGLHGATARDVLSRLDRGLMSHSEELMNTTTGQRVPAAKLKLPESWILILVIIAMCLVIGIAEPVFFTFENIINIIISISVISIVGIGMTMVILTGGIDVSVGGILALSATIAGSILQNKGIPIVIPIIISLLVGTAAGAFNGFCTAVLRIPALIVTLAMLSVTRGLVLIYTHAQASYGFAKSFLVLGQGRILGIPIIVYLTIILVAAGIFILNLTTFGRKIYAVGNNQTASRIVGIRVKAILIAIYAITGALCAIAGLDHHFTDERGRRNPGGRA